MTGALSVQCSCGSTAFTLRGEPAARAHCHCNACRDFYGTAGTNYVRLSFMAKDERIAAAVTRLASG